MKIRLYRWVSDDLTDYTNGYVTALGTSVDAARKAILRAKTPYGMQMPRLATDIAQEPEISDDGVSFTFGGG